MKTAPEIKKFRQFILFYIIFFQRSILSGLVHFVQEICIFLRDENAIN